ncbi:MAG TPA: A24 family peptidase [Acidimicrobiales bacterium]|nr:A24 family peptidase [Acidimicrobiales bacterium]
MDVVGMVLAGIVGLLAGSLANHFIVREPGYVITDPKDLPEGADESLLDELEPAPTDLPPVPVLALVRPGRAWRWWFPVTEVVMGLTFVAVVAELGWSAAGGAVLFLVAALVTIAGVDLRVYRIPDRLNFPSMGIGFACIVAAAFLDGDPGTVVGAAIGGVLYAGILFVAHLISPRGMGWGDVKLAWLMGFYVGWRGHEPGGWVDQLLGPLRAVLLALVIGSVLGIVIGGGYAIARRTTKAVFPYGPSLAAGCIIAVVWGITPG